MKMQKIYLMAIILASIPSEFHAASTFSMPTVSMQPTIIKVEGLEPINQALVQVNQALDRINATVDRITHIPHTIGIMFIGAFLLYWGKSRVEKKECVIGWKNHVANGLLIGGGLTLVVAAPFIATKMQRFSTLV